MIVRLAFIVDLITLEIMSYIAFLILGLVTGMLSGMVGIGGGVIVVPTLVYAFGFSQLQAQGTTLMLMVPPIGILAAWTYFKNGHVQLIPAVLIALGIFLGGYLGARFAVNLPEKTIVKVFGVFLLLVSLKMIFGK